MTTRSEEVKSQPVRLLDVFALGPLMMYSGYRLQQEGSRLNASLGILMGIAGFGTILYNAKNYARIAETQ